jgi:CRP-like cAMP-binding protein
VREDPTTGRPISAIGRGGVFGKVAVLMNARQLFTVRTTSLTTVLKLERDNFTDVLRTYPKDARQVYFNLKAVSFSAR